MSLHSHAWQGIRIVILGKEPLLPMKIEQSISSLSPFSEVILSSFENYDDAFKFCKNNGDVGFLILSENCGDAPFQSVFRELAKPYEIHGLPCFAVILSNGTSNPYSALAVGKTPKLIDYIPYTDLIDPTKVATTFESLWVKYTLAFENLVLPSPLQQLFISQAEAILGIAVLHFQMRLLTNISAASNISWIESVALKWHPVLTAIEKSTKTLLEKQETLKTLMDITRVVESGEIDIAAVIRSNAALTNKIVHLSNHLSQHMISGTLEKEIERLALLSKPGAPFLIRHVHKFKDQILAIEKDSTSLKVLNG
jgi:hypothetical protein